MPGKRITDLQVSKYKELRSKFSQEAAAGVPIQVFPTKNFFGGIYKMKTCDR
jgi:hypothetical protein